VNKEETPGNVVGRSPFNNREEIGIKGDVKEKSEQSGTILQFRVVFLKGFLTWSPRRFREQKKKNRKR